MKEAKEKWIEEQCSEIEDNLNKNNSKTAFQVVKDLTSEKKLRINTTSKEHASRKKERLSIDGQSTAPSYTTDRPKEMQQYWIVL